MKNEDEKLQMTNQSVFSTKIIKNGRIEISEFYYGQALVIIADTIVFVGSNEDANKYIDLKTTVTDVSEKLLRVKLQNNGNITIYIDNEIFGSDLKLSSEIKYMSNQNSRLEDETFEIKGAINNHPTKMEDEKNEKEPEHSCLGAYSTLPDFKWRPGYYFLSISGSEYLHLYFWALKDLAWYLKLFKLIGCKTGSLSAISLDF